MRYRVTLNKLYIAAAILGCTCFFEGWAQDVNARMQNVALQFDAGNFENAAHQYKSMLDAPLLPWQQAMVTYNLGTAQLAQDNWNAALKTFQSINSDEILSPLLGYRLQVNITLARLLEAKAIIAELPNNSSASWEDYGNAMQLLREVEKEIAKAELLSCQLWQAEGSLTCETKSLEVDEIHLEAKLLFVKLLQEMHTFRLAHVSLQEGIISLLTSSKAALTHADFMANNSMNQALEKGYLDLFQQQEESWLPYWKTLEALLKQSTEMQKAEKLKLFEQASKHFFEGIKLLHSRKYADGQQAFSAAIDALNGLVKLVFGGSNLEELVHRVLAEYTLALLHEPIQYLSLSSLIEIQALLETPVSSSQTAEFKEDYKRAQHYLMEAHQAWEKAQPIHVRIYLTEAEYQIKHISQLLANNQEDMAKSILQGMIEAQKHALTLNRLRLSMEGIESSHTELDKLIQSTQAQAFQSTKEFYQAVIAKQKKEVHASSASQSDTQPVAWQAVLSPFIKGVKSAQQAEVVLQSSDEKKYRKAADLQATTLSLWKEALANMQKKKRSDKKQTEEQQSSENQPSQKDAQASPPPTPSEASSKPEAGDSSLNEVLRLLQEMENDDRSQPLLKTTPANKEVERPW